MGTDQMNTIAISDALEYVREIPAESIDLVVTDPPYESLNRWAGIGTTARMGLGKEGSGSDDKQKFFATISNAYLSEIVVEFYRVLKPNTHCYVMCDAVTLIPLWQYAIAAGFSNVKPLIWDKVSQGMGYHYRCRYEFVMMFDKGKNRKLNNLGIADVLTFKMVQGKDKLVPTQKPVELFELLIRQSSNEGEIVLDPFMGGGTTAAACISTRRNYIGCDSDAEHVDIAKARLQTPKPLQEALF